MQRSLRLERLEPRYLMHGSDLGDVAVEIQPVATAVLAAEGEASASAMPGFSLADVNPNSATYQQAISPSRYQGQVSAWYFTHTT